MIEHSPGDEDSELGKIIDELTNELDEKIDEMNDVESLNQALIVKEKRLMMSCNKLRMWS